MGILEPCEGGIERGIKRIAYLDQYIACLDRTKTILENFKAFNPDPDEMQCRYSLAKFLFPGDNVFKKVGLLSGGERLRAGLACILMAKEVPELLILDEPTNYLDLESLHYVEEALNQYRGGLLVVSHDSDFIKNVRVERVVNL